MKKLLFVATAVVSMISTTQCKKSPEIFNYQDSQKRIKDVANTKDNLVHCLYRPVGSYAGIIGHSFEILPSSKHNKYDLKSGEKIVTVNGSKKLNEACALTDTMEYQNEPLQWQFAGVILGEDNDLKYHEFFKWLKETEQKEKRMKYEQEIKQLEKTHDRVTPVHPGEPTAWIKKEAR